MNKTGFLTWGHARWLQVSLNVLAPAFLFIVLVTPRNSVGITPLSFVYFPLELVLIGFALVVPGRTGASLRRLVSLLLVVGILFKIADMVAYQFLARPVSVFDGFLVVAGIDFLNSTVGWLGTFIAVVGLIILFMALSVLTFTALKRIQSLLRVSPRTSTVTLLAGLLVWLALSLGDWRSSADFSQQLAKHLSGIVSGFTDLDSFQQEISSDAYAELSDYALFSKLRGKDVLIVFIEAYGQIALDKPEFGAYVRPVLQQASAELTAGGFFARSGHLTSPTYGGGSWLAHSTALSGLWINHQGRYDKLMQSQRPSLIRLFQRAGWRTVGVMPAMTREWPDAQYFGYNQVYMAPALGYRGQPFSWVTMPDQYTLARFQSLERRPGPRAPVMAELALISSHAPWMPLPQLVDWEQVGDGSIFTPQTILDGPPAQVWQQNTEHLQAQYRKSIEYVMKTLVSYVLAYGDDNLVILALGDHQPITRVSGQTENWNVPVHLIARDPKVMAAVADWHWTEGMLPADDIPAWRMLEVRDRLIEAFSDKSPIPAEGVKLALTPAAAPDCNPETVYEAEVSWQVARPGLNLEIRINAPDGALFVSSSAGEGHAQTGRWVTHGTWFILLDRDSGKVLDARRAGPETCH